MLEDVGAVRRIERSLREGKRLAEVVPDDVASGERVIYVRPLIGEPASAAEVQVGVAAGRPDDSLGLSAQARESSPP
jgi:hypothetical protein